jgi:hypothetical protein
MSGAGRAWSPLATFPTEELVIVSGVLRRRLADRATPAAERPGLAVLLAWETVELAARFADFVEAAGPVASAADLAALAYGTGILDPARQGDRHADRAALIGDGTGPRERGDGCYAPPSIRGGRPCEVRRARP